MNGFIGEGLQAGRAGAGEATSAAFRHDGARRRFGCVTRRSCSTGPGSAITMVRSSDAAGGTSYQGFPSRTRSRSRSPTHHGARIDTGELAYRPTVHHAYSPVRRHRHRCTKRRGELSGRLDGRSGRRRPDEIVEALTSSALPSMGNKKARVLVRPRASRSRRRASWRRTTPATSLQVVARHPRGRGAVGDSQPRRGRGRARDEPRPTRWCRRRSPAPYPGELVGVYSGPDAACKDRLDAIRAADIDADPWQFKNFRVR